MLLTREIDIKVNTRNYKWYRAKGYKCQIKDVITINIKDLMRGSHLKVQYKCDKCGNVNELPFCSFISRQRIDQETYCKICASQIASYNRVEKYLAKGGLKLCRECNVELSADTDHYFQSCDTRDGFVNKCKKCSGYKFTDKLSKIPKDGYKFCIKCDLELLNTHQYFPTDRSCKNGLRSVCRKCGADGHFMEDDYVPVRRWSKNDNELFIKRYPHYTCEELLHSFYPSETRKSLHDRACRLGCTNTETYETRERRYQSQGEKISDEQNYNWGKPLPLSTRKKLSIAQKEYYTTHEHVLKGTQLSVETRKKISETKKKQKKWQGKDNPRHKNPMFGKDNPNWKGGTTPLYFELRSEIKGWQRASMEVCQYRCILTGGDFDHIHHLYPFRSIVNEVFNNVGLDERRTVADYTEEEFLQIKSELIKLHIQHGNGVCLRKDVHKLFHDLNGYTGNTPEQFNEFVSRFKHGEFDNILNFDKKLII